MTIPARTLRAYRRTTYEAGGIAVRIGWRARGMDGLLRAHGCRTGVFITAWNPRSRRMPPGWNRRRQIALAERLRGMTVLVAQGAWRGWHEAHLLVLDHPGRVRRLARLFRQHAVVQVRIGQRARLIGTSGCDSRTA